MLGDSQMITHGALIGTSHPTFKSQLSLFKGRHNGDNNRHNPIIISFKSALTHPFKTKGEVTAFHLIIGIETSGKHPIGSILVKIIESPADVIPDLAPIYTESQMFHSVPEIPPA
ncbi:hypothetical protein F7725_000107, partial [Dissostichus mawsoni]